MILYTQGRVSGHALAGQRVRIKGKGEEIYTVRRVVSTRFGLLAVVGGAPDHLAYPVNDCLDIQKDLD